MKRSSLLAVLLCLGVVPAAASAKYLHVRDVLPHAEGFIISDARYQQATGHELGHCWHNAPRIVECSYVLQGVAVCGVDRRGALLCPPMDLDNPAPAPPSRWYLIAVLRGGRIHLHAG